MATLTRPRAASQPPPRHTPIVVFGALWLVSVVGLGGLVLSGKTGMANPVPVAIALGLGLALSAALIWALPGPSFVGLELGISPRRFVPLAVACWAALVLAVSIIPVPWSLLVLVVAAGLVLARFGSVGTRGELLYAGGLAVVACVAGLGNGHNAPFLPLWQWGLLQVPLTFLGLLAGWAIARRLGLFDRGIGTVHLLSRGPRAALLATVEGVVLAVPFCLVGVVLSTAGSDSWATHWWSPLVALQPAISEEAYARVFLLSFLVMLFLRVGAGSLRGAWLGAVLVGVYWFAYIHGRPGDILSGLLVGTLFNLPLTYVWMRRGLEAAMGFHFLMDGLRWLLVLLVAQRVLPG